MKLLITAGPTREPIDPVRFISNYSTGTLGHILAQKAKAQGYRVTLISGPTALETPKGVKKIEVETASQMGQAVSEQFPKADVLIMSAAVADFRPIRAAAKKIKRSGAVGSLRLWQLEFIENPDIVAEAARSRKASQVIVGFALETEKLLPNARAKMKTKGLDAVVATRLSPKHRGKGPFGPDPVEGAILDRFGRIQQFKSVSKPILAEKILDTVKSLLKKRA